ncbi:transcription initiation factor TFIIA [Pycnococcus provasolii]
MAPPPGSDPPPAPPAVSGGLHFSAHASYLNVINHVIASLRPVFFQEGAGELELDMLKKTWINGASVGAFVFRGAGYKRTRAGSGDTAVGGTAEGGSGGGSAAGTKRKREDEDAGGEGAAATAAAEDDDGDGDDLNSDDDDDDDEAALATKDLLLAQYESVHHAKGKWRIALKAGVVHVNGRDVPFSTAKAELQF